MAFIRLPFEGSGFGGIMPAIDPEKLGYHIAQQAEEVNLAGETLAPFKGRTTVEGLGDSLQKVLYHYHQPRYKLICDEAGTLAAFQGASNGAFIIGDDQYHIFGVDTSGAASLAAVAVLIQAKMRDYDVGDLPASTCDYVGGTDKFEFTYNDLIPYLQKGYSDEINVSGYGSNSGGMASPDDPFDGNLATYGAAVSVAPPTTTFVKKDFGATGQARLTKIIFEPHAQFGYYYDETPPSAKEVVPGFMTMTIEASQDDAVWHVLGSTTIANATTGTTELIFTGETFYRYIRITMLFDPSRAIVTGTSYGYILAEAELTGYTYSGVDDFSSSTYLQGLSSDDIATSKSDSATFLTWPNADVKVAKSPGAGDRYSSIYWTDAEKLQSYGTYGQRDVSVERPTPPSVELVDVYAESFVGRSQIVYAGPTTLNTTMEIKSTETTDVGYIVTFVMPEIFITSGTTPTFEYQFDITGAPQWIGINEVGSKYAQISDGVQFASVEISELNGNIVPGISGTDYTWTEREVILTINMNYRLQTNATYFYVMTYKDDLGREGEPSPLTGAVVRNAEQRNTLTLPVSSDSNIKQKLIYRSNNNTDVTSGFFFVKELDNATTSYIDWTRDEDNTRGLVWHTNPPDFLEGIAMMAGGFAVAFKGRTFYASEAYRIYSWLPSYELNFDSDIIRLFVTGNECYVLTNDQQYMITGDTPDTLTSYKIDFNQSCSSNRGVARVGSTTYYISPDGVVGLLGANGDLITDKNFFQPRDWASYNPDTFICEQYNGKLYACSDTIFFVMDFQRGLKAISTLKDLVVGLHYDSVDDVLYCIVSNQILSIDTDAANHESLSWKSKEYKFPKPVGFAAVRVEAESYVDSVAAVQIALYANGALIDTISIADQRAKRIPIHRKEKVWSFLLTSQHEIRDVQIGSSIQELND